jgi:hypothetical protein
MNHSEKKSMEQIQTIRELESPLRRPEGRTIGKKMRNKFVPEFHGISSTRLLDVPRIDVVSKLLRIGVIGLMLCAANAWAGPASIQGIVKDPKGHPIKGADVRIESRDGKKLVNTAKTDANGRYVSTGLAAGMYRVTLVVNGAVKASIMNTQTRADQPTQLNFDLKPASTSQAATAGAKTGKHVVWVPATTGSHMGGRWVEVDESNNGDANALNVKRANAEALHREQQRMTTGPGGLGGTVGNGTGP